MRILLTGAAIVCLSGVLAQGVQAMPTYNTNTTGTYNSQINIHANRVTNQGGVVGPQTNINSTVNNNTFDIDIDQSTTINNTTTVNKTVIKKLKNKLANKNRKRINKLSKKTTRNSKSIRHLKRTDRQHTKSIKRLQSSSVAQAKDIASIMGSVSALEDKVDYLEDKTNAAIALGSLKYNANTTNELALGVTGKGAVALGIRKRISKNTNIYLQGAVSGTSIEVTASISIGW